MEHFEADLKYVMQNFDTDKDILDDYKIGEDFISHIIDGYLGKEGKTLVSVKKVEVCDGPNMSGISTSIILKFEAIVLLPWKVEEEIVMTIFVKTRAFRVYKELFAEMKEYLDHPVKGPYVLHEHQGEHDVGLTLTHRVWVL